MSTRHQPAHRLLGLMTAVLVGIASIATGVSTGKAAQIACAPATPAFATSATPVATPAESSLVPSSVASFPEEGGTLTIFAAASLTDAFAEMEGALEGQNEDLDIIVETGSSQTLVTQLQEGAEADVLATANTSTMTQAVESGLIDGEPVTFTGNHLVIVTPPDNPAAVEDISGLTGAGLRLVVADESVPAGRYAREAICAWGSSGSAPNGAVEAIGRNIISEEEDVRNALAKVQLGEADAGIVYASDATASELAGTPVEVVEFPEGVPTAAIYPIGATATGNQELADPFIDYILSPDGQAVLADYGFSPVAT